VGISADDQQRIFEEFQQVGQGLAGKTEGTGLGLTLAKKFVELYSFPFAVQKVQKLNFQGGLSCGSTVL
jgi:K+-sensing histidine kinase KdpD